MLACCLNNDTGCTDESCDCGCGLCVRVKTASKVRKDLGSYHRAVLARVSKSGQRFCSLEDVRAMTFNILRNKGLVEEKMGPIGKLHRLTQLGRDVVEVGP